MSALAEKIFAGLLEHNGLVGDPPRWILEPSALAELALDAAHSFECARENRSLRAHRATRENEPSPVKSPTDPRLENVIDVLEDIGETLERIRMEMPSS